MRSVSFLFIQCFKISIWDFFDFDMSVFQNLAISYINYYFSVNLRLLNSSLVLEFGLCLQISEASSVSSFGFMSVLSKVFDLNSAVPPTSILNSNKFCPTGEYFLRCSSTLMAKSRVSGRHRCSYIHYM